LYRLRGRRSNGWPPSKDKRAKQRNAVLPDDVNIHDIRRTVADALLNRIGAPPWIVDHVVLGHSRPKLLRTYMPTLPLNEARDVLQRWGSELEGILAFPRAVNARGDPEVSVDDHTQLAIESFNSFLTAHPAAGDVMPGTGGAHQASEDAEPVR